MGETGELRDPCVVFLVKKRLKARAVNDRRPTVNQVTLFASRKYVG